MIKFFDILNILYTKKKEKIEVDTSLNLTLSKWLSYDKTNLKSLCRLLKYQFYVEPKHYFQMLFYNIPKRNKAPFLKKINKQEEKEDKLINKFAYILNWSKQDIKKNQSVLNEVITKNSSYWKKELGLK